MEHNRPLLDRLQKHTKLLDLWNTRKQIVQVHLIREKEEPGRQFLVANTHLYFKPTASDVRMLQIYAIINYLHHVLKQQTKKTSVILCGDLNSLKGSDVVKYLSGEDVTEDAPTWTFPASAATGFRAHLKNPLDLVNISGFPPFTNYTPPFKETIDYVFASKSDFEVISVLPQPLGTALEPWIGLPCVIAPSDHLSVVVEMKWNDETTA